MMKKNKGRVRVSMSLYLDKAIDREIHDNLKALAEQFGGNLSETLKEICRSHFGIGFPPLQSSVALPPRVEKRTVSVPKPQEEEPPKVEPSVEVSKSNSPKSEPIRPEPTEKKSKIRPKGLWKA